MPSIYYINDRKKISSHKIEADKKRVYDNYYI